METLNTASSLDAVSERRRGSALSFAGLMETAAFLALGGTLVAWLGGVHWVFELATHFPAQYALCLGCGAAVALVRRRWKSGLSFLFGLVLNLIVLWPAGAVRQVPDGLTGERLRLLSMNVLSSNHRHEAALRLVQEEQPDLVVVMELTDAWSRALSVLERDYPHRVVEAREDNFGIACYCRVPILRHEVVVLGPAAVPSILLELELGRRTVFVMATHPLPPVGARQTSARDQQLLAGGARLPAGAEPSVLVGDFNTTPWAPIFPKLLAQTGLRDTLAGRGWQPTWPAALGWFGIPIDHCLVSSHWTVSERRPCRSIGSDHRPLLVELRLDRNRTVATLDPLSR